MSDLWERKLKLLEKEKSKRKTGETLRIASIVEESIVDGPGLRFVVFTQGCPHKCKGCHNPQTHNKFGGMGITIDEILEKFDSHLEIDGITISGGEPFMQPRLLSFLSREIRKRGKNVIVYTGFTHERLQEMAKTEEYIEEFLKEIDLLIDGPFILEKRSLDLSFVGSTNQRLIPLTEEGDRLVKNINNSH